MLAARTRQWKRGRRKKRRRCYVGKQTKSLSTAKTTVSGGMWRWFQTVAMKSNDCLALLGEGKHSSPIITQLVLAMLLWRRSTLVSVWNGMSSCHDGQQTWKSVVEVRTTGPGGSLLLSSRGWRYLRHMRLGVWGSAGCLPPPWTSSPGSNRRSLLSPKDTGDNKADSAICWV